MNFLEAKYKKEIAPNMLKTLNYSSIMQVAKLEKVVVNVGVGDAVTNTKIITRTVEEITKITGQKPIITKAKKSIAGFKLRAGMPIGVKVTLRKEKMYDFFIKLVNIALPKVRDFQGLSRKSFDKNGNYSFGIKEQIIFPEINYEDVDTIRGLQVTIVTTATSRETATMLLEKLDFPFKKTGKKEK